MISEAVAIEKAKSIATNNNCVWREADIRVEWVAARAPSENWLKRTFLESAQGFPACWLVRMGATPSTGDWLDENLKDPRGEGYGYLIDAESAEFLGIDVGYSVTPAQYMNMKR